MGIKMLGGILDPLANILSMVFENVLSPILSGLVKLVLGPILNVVITIGSYILGLFFYGISTFVLKLIDFVELLFRALAGLPGDMTLRIGGYNGDVTDPVFQLIVNPVIQEAFLAMCIVGIFLLVITTIFQMIRVEYTTEGAKNAKGPILEKAFKGLANLLLIPILVVFGVIIGNQILGLIDNATKGANDEGQPTISGLLFTTAASEAFYLKNEEETIFYSTDIAENIAYMLPPAIEKAFKGDESDAVEKDYKESLETREQITYGFICQDAQHKYYNILDVTRVYNYSAINYLLLIIGGGIVLKCLFFTCFGMIIRLYQCAAYFILVPVVIGMMPVREGGFKTWVSKFMGLALSAYGTIISLNVFFIITRVMLNIDISWGSEGSINDMFASTTLTSLVKCVFTLGGCLMIEKLSKSFGDFFGAEDAMSSGKGLAGEMKEPAKKAIGGTMAVATGALALGGKMAGGIANSVKSSYTKAGGGVKGVAAGIGSGLLTATGIKGIGSALSPKANFRRLKTGVGKVKDGIAGSSLGLAVKKKGLEKGLRDAESNQAQAESNYQANRNQRKELEGLIKSYESQGNQGDADEARAKIKKLDIEARQLGKKKAQAARGVDAEKARLETDSDYQSTLGKIEDKRVKRAQNGIYLAATGKALRSSVAKNNPLYSFFDSNIAKPWHDAEEAGAKYSKEAETAYGNIKEARKDRVSKSFDNSVAGNIAIATKAMQDKLMTEAMKNMSKSVSDLNTSLKKYSESILQAKSNITEIQNNKQMTQKEKDEAIKYQNDSIYALQQKMKEINPKIEFDLATKEVKGSMNVKLDTSALKNIGGSNSKELEDSIKAAMEQASKDGNKILMDELKKALDELKKQIEGMK